MSTLASESQNNRAEADAKQSMVIAVSGATGLVGTAVCTAFGSSGNRVLRLVRRPSTRSVDEIYWNPEDDIENTAPLQKLNAIVQLAGENIADGRWSTEKKLRVRNSRVQGTRTLCEQIGKMERPPQVLVCASAIGCYGDRDDVKLTEESEPGAGFLADVCREWEAATEPAIDRGVRVVNLRIGVVLSQNGGALAELLTPFRMALGGRVGSGQLPKRPPSQVPRVAHGNVRRCSRLGFPAENTGHEPISGRRNCRHETVLRQRQLHR